MRILAITPIRVTDDELVRRQERYDRLAPAGVQVHLDNLADSPDAPRALDTAEQVAASETLLAAQFSTADPSRYDALLPDCVLDPLVGGNHHLPLPLHGISRLTAHHLTGLGGRIGAVARNGAIADELDRKLASYGIVTTAPTAVMDLSFDAIADDAVWAEAVDATISHLDLDAVINACSAVDVSAHGSGPRLVDPTRLALELLGLHAHRAASV
jgi:Asp/Glu/hydantoin racemase